MKRGIVAQKHEESRSFWKFEMVARRIRIKCWQFELTYCVCHA